MDTQTLDALAEFICGDDSKTAPVYRTGSELSRFFARVGLGRFVHDGSTRKWWTLNVLTQCTGPELQQVILRLADPKEYRGDAGKVSMALSTLDCLLAVEGLAVRLEGVTPRLVRVTASVTKAKEEKPLVPLPPPDFLRLNLEPGVGELLASRWQEAQRCVEAQAHLAATIVMGSLLEGLLLGVCQRFPRDANMSLISPKDGAGKVKHFAAWTLSEFIEVAHERGWIGLDVKKFSHALREFRNLIHPYQQLAMRVEPDRDTCGISWLVVQAAANDLAKVLNAAP